MKNKILMTIVFVIICMSLCACTGNKRSSDEHEEKILFFDMIINSLEANYNMGESNRYMIAALQSEDSKEAKEYIEKALNLVIESEEKMKTVISSPNFVEEELKKLQENYKETAKFIQKLPDLSEEEMIVFEEGTVTHVKLLKCFTSFSFLYNIREFDKMPEDEANKVFKEKWMDFGFEEDIKCPDTIEKKELYHIWARQWLEKELSDETIGRIETLRKNDNLISKECNKEWMDFINLFCSKENMDTN